MAEPVFGRENGPPTAAGGQDQCFTPRERDVLRLLAKGWTNGQIEGELGVSTNTVRFHLKNIYSKLEVDGRGMAIIETLKLGIV